MFENYPEENENHTYARGNGKEVVLDAKRIRKQFTLDVPPSKDGPYETLIFYNQLAGLINRDITFEPELPQEVRGEPTIDNYHERGLRTKLFIESNPVVVNATSRLNDEKFEEFDAYVKAKPELQSIFDAVINLLGGEEPAGQEYDGGLEFENLANYLSIRDISSSSERKQIYDYWENYYKRFSEAPNKQTLIEFEVPAGEDMPESMFRLKQNPFILPCVVVQHTTANYMQEEGAVGIFRIANEVFREVTQMTRDEFKQEFSETELVSFISRDGDADNAYREQLANNLREVQKAPKEVDPLTYLHLSKESKMFYTGDEDEKVKKLLKSYLKENFSGLQGIILKVLDNLADETLEDYKEAVVDSSEGVYYLPILDNHIQELSKIPLAPGMEIPYFTITIQEVRSKRQEEMSFADTMDDEALEALGGERGQLVNKTYRMVVEKKNRTFSNYQQVVRFVNSNLKTFFNFMKDESVLGELRAYNPNVGVKVARSGSGSRGSLSPASVGPKYPAIAGELPTMVEVEGKEYNEFIDFIYEKYAKDLRQQFFFNRDIPSFMEETDYQTFIAAYTSLKEIGPTSIVSQLTKYPSTAIELEDLKALNDFWSNVRKGSTGSIGALIEAGEDSISAFLLLNSKIDESRANITSKRKRIADSLGKIIYDIARLRDMEQVASNVFLRKQISEYRNATIDKELLDILPILNSKMFTDSLTKPERKEVQELSSNLKGNFYREIMGAGDTDAEKAFLKAIDTIRGEGGLYVYKAYLDLNNVENVDYVSNLIRKEDRVDIYAMDMEKILSMNKEPIESVATKMGVSETVIYKVRGLFR